MEEKAIPGPGNASIIIWGIRVHSKATASELIYTCSDLMRAAAVSQAVNNLTTWSPGGRGLLILGGRWLHWTISHKLCYSAPASDDFQIEAKQSLNWLVKFLFSFHRYLMFILELEPVLRGIQRPAPGTHSIRCCWRREWGLCLRQKSPLPLPLGHMIPEACPTHVVCQPQSPRPTVGHPLGKELHCVAN